jgi:hypothetical protein
VAIGVLLGLPFFAFAMIAADAVFLPTSFLVWSGRGVTNYASRVHGVLTRRTRATRASEPVAT